MSRSKNSRRSKQRKRLRDVTGFWAPRRGIRQTLEIIAEEFPALVSQQTVRIEEDGEVKETVKPNYAKIVGPMRHLVKMVPAIVPDRFNGNGKILGWTYYPPLEDAKREQDYRLKLARPFIHGANELGKTFLELPANFTVKEGD